MDSILGELAEPFERMSPAGASALLLAHYGVAAEQLELLDTERDDSFRVTSAQGEFVLKVAHPSDDPALDGLQSAAMGVALEAGLPVQRVIAPRSPVPGRSTRLLTWLDGDLMAEHDPSGQQLFAAGVALGRLSDALREFEHPTAHRVLAWDLRRTGQLRQYTDDAVLLGVIDRFVEEVAPVASGLPHQVIHNDFHPGNVLVDPTGEQYVVGILDFGDIVHSARVFDLGVAMAYLVPDDGPVWAAGDALVAGFESVVPLLDDERALLPALVAARLVMRVVIPAIVPQPRTDTLHYVDRNRRLLDRVLEET